MALGIPPLLKWPGGKSRLSRKLARVLPPHDTYVEPFAGGAAVFFEKPLVKRNILGDKDHFPIEFYQKVRRGGLRRCQGGIKKSKSLFDRSANRNDACHMLARNKLSFHGNRKGYLDEHSGKVMWKGLLGKLQSHERKLRRAHLVNGDFKKTMRRFDGYKTVHFVDPPWDVGYSKQYHQSKVITPAEMRKFSDSMKGAVVAIYDDSPAVRRAFCGGRGWKCLTARTHRGGRLGKGNEPTRFLVAVKKARRR